MPHLLPAAASALAAAAPAAASTAAATAAKATLMTTLKSVAFNALTNLAISTALSVFQPQVGQSGRTFEFVIDPDGPIPFAAGRVGVAGSVIHRDTFGPDLMYYGIPFVLSGAGPITAIESFKADDYPMSFDANGGATTEPYRQELFFRYVLGHQPAPVALTTPSGFKNGATLPGWTSAHKLSGKAAGVIFMAENSKGSAFPTGEIKPLVTFRGLKVYDPRLDSTYPGGSGSHRLNNAATWTYSANPILWALKWTLGLWEGPIGKGAPQVDYQVGGIGAKLSGIDVPAFVAAANVADANGWTVSAYPNTDDDKHQVLETFLQAGGAIYSQRAGKISCIQRAAPRTSIVTISAADTAGPLEIDTAASRIDRINTLRPRFWSPAHRWQMTALDGEVTATTYREQDGAVRSRGIDYPYVSDARQAAQLAALQIAHTREGIAGVIPLKPHLQRIRPGDAFTITEPGFVLNGLKCLCLNTDYDPATGVVRVSFVSETDGKYPFALGQDPTPPEPQVLTPVDPRFVSPPEAGDWTITPRPPAPGGGGLPSFDLTGVVSNATATAIIVEYGPTATGPWTQAYQGPPTVTNIPIEGLQPGATYYVAIQYQRNQNYSERYVYGPYTAPLLDPSPNAPTIQAINADITAAFGDIFDVSELVGQTRADLEAADAQISSTLGQTRADLEAADASLYGNIVVLDNRAGVLETQTQSLETNKASVASLNAQIVRINDVEAVNATQALALVDLENGKVALSEYNTLKGEVVAGRDGQPSLLAKIENLKAVDLDLQQNKASVQAVSALGVRTESLEADITGLQQVTADLEAKKATSEALNAQRLRIDDVEAVNATQALALVDLENGKVALSEYNTLKGEVTAARDGAPSLLGQIQNLKSVDLDLENRKASVESVNALTARTANTEADIIDLELALATETGARAQAIQQVSASNRNRPNMLANGSGELGLRGLSCIHIGGGGVVTPLALFAEDTSWGRIIRIGPFGGGTYILEWDDVTAVGSTPFTITGDAVVFGLAAQDRSYFDIQCLDGNGNLVPGGDGDQNPIYGSHDFSPDDANRNAYAVSFTTPAGTVRVRSRFIVEAQNSNPSYIAVRQVKTERGSLPASRYSADASQAVIEASVTEQSLAIIDLETQQALASYQLIAAATGGKPARFALVSSTAGSYVAIDAPYIFWGDNTVFDDATDTLQTTVGPNIRVLAFGAPFGASGNLLEWWGPSSIAIGSMTTANGLNGRMTTAPYVFDNVVVTVAARFAAGTVTVFRTTSSTTAAQLTSTGTVLVEASVTSTSENDVTAPIVTADVVGVSSGGVETVLATKSMGSGLPEDPLVYTFAPVQGSYPTYRVKVRGSGPVSKNGQSTVEVTLKTSPVA